MAVVTITTDLGTADYYLAALKGLLLKQCKDVNLVDINCNLKHYDIKQAVYNLTQAYPYFPQDTVHLVHINPAYNRNRLLITSLDNQFFVSFDNGFLPLFLRDNRSEIFAVKQEITNNPGLTYFDAFTKIAAHLTTHKSIGGIADNVTDYTKMTLPPVSEGPAGIKGAVISIDAFGNAITNISRDMFDKNFTGKRFALRINHIMLREIKKHYSDVDEGDLLCLFNQAGLLEVAINRGKANNLLGLSVGHNVLIVPE